MKERLKTYLLFFLALTTLYLTVRNWVYDPVLLQSPAFSWIRQAPWLFGLSDTPAQDNGPVESEYQRAALPIKIAVMREGVRSGWFYAQARRRYDALSGLVGEALGSASPPALISQEQWQRDILSDNIYIEYDQPVPFSVLGAWEHVVCTLEDTVRGFSLRYEDGKVYLMYVNEQGFFFSAETKARDLAAFQSDADSVAAGFLFERSGSISRQASVLLPDALPGQNRLRVSPSQIYPQDFLRGVEINPDTNTHYPEAGGTEVYIDNLRTVRITSAGELQYRNPDTSDERFILSDQSLPGMVDAGRLLAASIKSGLGDASFSLFSIDRSENRTSLLFLPEINGIPIRDGAYAEVIFENGCITAVNARVSRYTLLEETCVLLPPMQAAALLPRESSGLGLYYQDGPDVIDCRWYYYSAG